MNNIAAYAKAIVAFMLAGLTALGTALIDESISRSEWVTVVIAALSTSGVVWAVPNKTPSVHEALTTSAELDQGQLDRSLLITIAAIVVIVCGIVWFWVAVVD